METDKKQIEQLFEKAQLTCEKAFAPYSNFYVGAALLTEKGNMFTGCNVENASYGLTSCAERNAIFAAVNSEGPEMKIKYIAVATKNSSSITPCGACRQVIAEFANSKNEKTRVIFPTQNGVLACKNFDELLPGFFQFKSE